MDKGCAENKLVVGQARILYADAEGRVKIASAFNQAIAKGDIGTIVLGRDHHDVSGTDLLTGIKHLRRIVLQPIWLFKT
jgi:urocanate hydratase